ncbi:hypothetical protein QTP70_021214 [Hemibagrus guttatus]|uniref:ribonuclease H n=1 Tax=Hemibagrus guttatus TaxID=175788 RepID=A0AAE0QYV4_9TELE|nr:hypothetical protein QTP70_021214 [Hemibagrus guttatus]
MQSNHRCLELEVNSSEPKITQTTKDMEVPLGAQHLSLFAEDQNGNDISCLSDTSSDSPRDSSSHGQTYSPADVEMTEDCVSDLISSASIIKKVDKQSHMAAVSCMKTAGDNCNQNMTFMITGLQNGNIDSESIAPDVRDLPVKESFSKMCPNTDAEQAFVIGSVPPSHSRSSERYSSVSSGEMLIRSNSFIIHESDRRLSASVLEESSDMPSDVGMMPSSLPDVCEGLVNNMVSATGQNNTHPDFGVTFIQPCNQTFTMEEDVFQPVFHNGPEGSRASHLVAGVNHIECVTPTNMKKSHIEAERASCSTSIEGKTFHVPSSEELDISGNAQTSTPVQSLSSKTFCFPDSPLNNSKSVSGSPLVQVLKEQQSSLCQNPKTSLTASTKIIKLETKKYAKDDFSNIRSKIMSKPNSVLKPSNVSVVNASSNIKQPKIQSRPSHSMQSIASPTKSASAMSSSSTLTCGSLKMDQNNVIKRARSSTCQDTAPARKSRPRMWSETLPKTNGEDPTVKDSQITRTENTSANAKSSSIGGFLRRTSLTKLGDRHSSREEKCLKKPQKPSPKLAFFSSVMANTIVNVGHTDFSHFLWDCISERKLVLQADSSRPVGTALCDWRKSSLGSQPLSSRPGGALPAQTPAANLRPPPPSASKFKPGTARKNGCTTSAMPSPSLRSKLSTSKGNPTMRVTEGTGAEGSGGTVSRFSLTAGHPHSSASKLPMKTRTQVKSLSSFSGLTKPGETLFMLVSKLLMMLSVHSPRPQYGFMPRKSTTDAIFALRILMEKYRDGQRELHCVFVDLEKAYDRVPREELWYCMRKSGVAEKYVRVVQDMYERSRTVVRCAVGQIEEFKVEVGLHQGSALSPFLFAMVIDQLSEEVRQESPWTMMFADDIVICSESREQVEENLERWRFVLERRGMKVSRSKTEYMCVNEREGSGTVRLQGEEVKKVQEFKYLGSTVQSNGECGKGVKKRVQAGDKKTSSLSNTPGRCAVSVSKPPVSSRPARIPATVSVDKSKAKGSSRSQQQGHTNGHPDLVPPETKPRGLEYYKSLCEKKSQTIQQLKNNFIASNRRFEAIAVVVQTLYIQSWHSCGGFFDPYLNIVVDQLFLSEKNEESVKRRQEHAVELLNLREELVNSAQSCDRLEKEKEELHAAFDGVLQKVQEQHRLDLADLEERLKTFYTNEWEKIQQSYQEEAEKYKGLMEQQLEELRAKHEAMQKDLEESHEEKVKGLKQHYEESFEELRKYHDQEMQALEKMQKETESTLTNQIEELTTANSYFSERLKAEEDRRKELAEKCLKDSHTLYLEQELESLKVVLDIKNKQIHQQDKKVMQMEKLVEKNVKLEECLNKVQQENEDLKARMDRHAALSRQLSTEQAVLQESLQKETKVNKRLSMENEELLWKLQNGDLSSPRKISPSSPSMTLQSPRHSGLFSSPPVSPR